MFSRHLIFATALAFQAAAFPAAEPIDEAKKCWTSWDVYRSSSEWYQGQSTTELVSTEEFVSTSVDSDVPLTTLCDGKARALEPYKTVVITETETLESPTPTTFTRDYTEPSPTCSIGESACSSLIYTHDLNQRHCTISQTYPPCAATSASCRINIGGQRTLMYWPVQTSSGDFCAQNGTTVDAKQTISGSPNTAVLNGVTYTSPTNYISFNAVSADVITRIGRHLARLQCGGPTKLNQIVPLTAPVYSAANYANYGDSTYSFNFADLNTVPAEAYSRQYKCGFGGAPESCTGVMAYQAEYTPIIVMPDLKHLDAEWEAAGCLGNPEIYDMPQVALATPTPA